MNSVFTIVAKNYLPLAYSLHDSIKQQHPDLDFFIFIADKASKEDRFDSRIKHIYLEELGLSQQELEELAFKYNVTEFCTSIKPHCFKFLQNNNYTKAIYFDPDIYVYQSLDFVYGALDTHFLVITPHYCTLEQVHTGVRNEGMILFSGAYNLGFCAVNIGHTQGSAFVAWWAQRLYEGSYADKTDGLHTDQKWIDLVHCVFDGPILVLKHPGTNAAIWNMHEREIRKEAGVWQISYKNKNDWQAIVFYHFSSFNYYAQEMPNKLYEPYKERFPSMVQLCQEYRQNLVEHKLVDFKGYSYGFDVFDNGEKVSPLHRRIYRRLTDLQLASYKQPFATGPGTYHNALKKNKLLFAKESRLEGQNETNMSGFDAKVGKVNTAMRAMKAILGIEKYFLLVKFFQRYFRFENQYFLLEEYKDHYKFLNENRPDR